ncbi:MAG: divalent metal cation transporter [Chloroflexi bacterium]|nr:divalent metal cation transporter [Chloroflexota bacterium]MBI3341289.1 divalent metal cation transporter [Chloroflexota bacterium]
MMGKFLRLRDRWTANRWLGRVLVFLSVFGPATITAMADNDASGVATYSIAGALLGYPVLFLLTIITVLLGITQEMGMRLTLVTRRGLADLIREKFGVKVSLFIFIGLLLANLGTIVVDLAAVNTTSEMLGIPTIPFLLGVLLLTFVFITWGNYKLTQNIMLAVCLFYFAYIFSAVKAKPDWGLALSNLIFPNGVTWTGKYIVNYLVVGMGVLGTTITPWGQFFISSFAFDKKMDENTIKYSQFETYWGAFLTNFFSFFMIVATAATLYVRGIQLNSGDQAALAIKPFAGALASSLFAYGILAAGFMGIVIVSLSTAYAFSEFFGLSGSLDTDFRKSRTFYTLFLAQLLISALILLIPGASLFNLAIASQVLNAMILPLVFFYLIRLTSSKNLMGGHVNNRFQKYFTSAASVFIVIASAFTVAAVVFRW